jgi:hypothetical protein
MTDTVPPTGAVFLSGPMSGRPDYNVPLFEEAAANLRSLGFHIISPVELFKNAFGELWLNQPRSAYLYAAYAVLMDPHTHGIALLSGWEYSDGSFAEAVVAKSLELKFYHTNGCRFDPPTFNKSEFDWK